MSSTSLTDLPAILTAEELAAARANVAAAPPLTPAQLDVLGAILRPAVHRLLTTDRAGPTTRTQ